jgi:cobalt-zinc-cadmium efflux system outer membrane protein
MTNDFQKNRSPIGFLSVLGLMGGLSMALPVRAQPKRAEPLSKPTSPSGLGEIDAAIEACSTIGTALARAHVRRGDAEIEAAAVLPNPDVVFNDNRSLTGPKDHETIIGLSVPLGLGGSRFVLQDAAEAEREAALLGAGQGAFEMALEVRERFARASLAAARLAVWQQQQDAVAALIERVEKLEAGGEAASYDILRLRARQRASRLKTKPLRAGLQAERRWLQTMAGAEVAIDSRGGERLVAGVTSARRQRAEHPLVARLNKEAEAERLRAQAAQRRWAPDVDVFVGYRTVGGLNQQRGHGLSVNLTVPLTFFDHGQGEARRARARAELSEAQAAVARRRFEAQKQRALARDGALEAADGGVDAVEVAERWVDAATKLYQAGEGSLLDVLEAFQARTQARLAELDVLEQRVNAQLAWMRASGDLASARLEAACGIARKEMP